MEEAEITFLCSRRSFPECSDQLFFYCGAGDNKSGWMKSESVYLVDLVFRHQVVD